MAQWKQYSGMWTRQQQLQAIGQNNWNNVTPVDLTQGVYVWGNNSYGRLGTGNTVSTSSPVQLTSSTAWKSFASGSSTFGVKIDGTAWSWGGGFGGVLCQNSTTDKSSPTQIGSLNTWLTIAGGYNHMVGILSSGIMLSCGQNYSGQLGINVAGGYRSSPVQIGALTTWLNSFASYRTSFATKTDNTLWAWGYNGYGQLGLGNSTTRYSPAQVGSLTNWSYVAPTPGMFTVALKTDGTLWSCGYNNYGQLGQNNITNRSSPVQIGSNTNWRSVAASYDGGYAITTNGTLWSWGRNNAGQLGQNDTIDRSSPVQIGALTTWANVYGLYYGFVATKKDGTLWGAAQQSSGELAQGNTIAYSSPVQIGTNTTWYVNSDKSTAFNSSMIAIKSAA